MMLKNIQTVSAALPAWKAAKKPMARPSRLPRSIAMTPIDMDTGSLEAMSSETGVFIARL